MSLPSVWGRFLLRLVRELAPASAIELGTGFGLSTAYQAAAHGAERPRGGDELRRRGHDRDRRPRAGEAGARQRGPSWSAAGSSRRCRRASSGHGTIDYALVDHDHTEAGTMAAFDQLLPRLAPGAVVVFDDIGWTDEMRRAWAAVATRERRRRARSALRRLGVAVIEGREASGEAQLADRAQHPGCDGPTSRPDAAPGSPPGGLQPAPRGRDRDGSARGGARSAAPRGARMGRADRVAAHRDPVRDGHCGPARERTGRVAGRAARPGLAHLPLGEHPARLGRLPGPARRRARAALLPRARVPASGSRAPTRPGRSPRAAARGSW